VWDYANTTIPRHLRDVIVTEYGAADLRGKPDREVAIEMLKVADSAFQPGLLQRAIRAGKLEAGYSLPDGAGGNRTARISRALEPARRSGLLPRFPLGTEMTDTEQALTGPLGRLKSASKLELLRMLVAGAVVRSTTEGERKALARMALQAPSRLTDRLLRLLLLGALR
jgi:hypothetical protein